MEEFVELENGSRVPVYYHGLWEPVRYDRAREDQNYSFAGFDFRVQIGSPGGSVLLLDAILLNPEDGKYLSYHSFRISVPAGTSSSKEWAAAWLIAHWGEHFMHNCPCQVDDAKPSRFRYAFIDTLLYLENVV